MTPRSAPLLIFVFLAACGPTTQVAFCEQSAAASCKQAFRCKPDESKSAFTDQATCVKDLSARARCESFADQSSSCTLNGAATALCLRELENAACTSTAGALPESCRAVKCASSNKCARVTADASSGGCSYTLTDCADQNSYGVQCLGSACSCMKNGSAERQFSGSCATSASERLKQLQVECSFDVT